MTPGYHSIPFDKYLLDPCVVPSLSSSIAQIMLSESPRKAAFNHPRLNREYVAKEDGKFDIGKASHAMLLEGVNAIEVCRYDDWRKADARAARDAARVVGKIPLLEKHSDDVVAMVMAAEEFIEGSEIAEYWKDADSELTAISLEQGVWLRSRLDRITKNRRFIFDYKSTTDVAPEAFSRQITRMGYHIQESFYRRVVRNLGATGPRFVFVAQSCEAPYECSLHGCDPALQQIADAEVERAIGIWRQCMTKNEWPSYGGRVHQVMPPMYLIAQHEERLMEEAGDIGWKERAA